MTSKYKYDINYLYTLMHDHYEVEKNIAQNFYAYELLNYLTEYGGNVYYDPFTKIKNSEYKKIKKQFQKVTEETRDAYYDQLIEHTQYIKEYEEIVLKINKTERDIFIIAARRLMKVFNLRSLDKKFLNYINDIYYIDVFKNSLLFSMNDISLQKYKNKGSKTKFDKMVIEFLEKTEIIKELLKIYFPEGIADNTVRIVSSDKSHMTNEEIAFWNKYGGVINKYFPNVCQKQYHDKTVKGGIRNESINPQKLITKLNLMLKSYFGFGLIEMKPALNKNISRCVRDNIFSVSECFFNSSIDFTNHEDFSNIINVNDLSLYEDSKEFINDSECTKHNSIKVLQKGKQTTFHFFKLDNLKYLELLLNYNANSLDKSLIDIIKKNYENNKCYFKNNHIQDTFSDIIKCYRTDSCFDYNDDIIELPKENNEVTKPATKKIGTVKRIYDIVKSNQIFGDEKSCK